MRWLVLQKGEKVIAEYKPQFRAWMLIPLWRILIAGLVIGAIASVFANQSVGIAIFIVYVILSVLMQFLRYKHEHYVLTNKRIIRKRGLIGYSVTSVAYNRVSDVMIRFSFLEKIFGVGSVFIQTLAGQISRGRFGSEISYLFIKDPVDVQKRIFNIIGKG